MNHGSRKLVITSLESGWKTLRLALLGAVVICSVLATSNQPLAAGEAAPRVASRLDRSKADKTHKLTPALKIANESQKVLKELKGYYATFSKREVVGGRMLSQVMQVKLRHEPFSVYLKYQQPHAGREVIYVHGQNDGKLLAHESGLSALAGTLKLDPLGKDAMDENRYPVTMLGMATMLGKTIEQWESELQYDTIDVKYYPDAKLSDAECQVIQTSHTEKRPEVKFYMTRLYVDKKTKLPIRVEQYGFPSAPGTRPPLIEEYTYLYVRADVNVTDYDFDTDNRQYDF